MYNYVSWVLAQFGPKKSCKQNRHYSQRLSIMASFMHNFLFQNFLIFPYTYYLEGESTHFDLWISTHFGLEVSAQFKPKKITRKIFFAKLC